MKKRVAALLCILLPVAILSVGVSEATTGDSTNTSSPTRPATQILESQLTGGQTGEVIGLLRVEREIGIFPFHQHFTFTPVSGLSNAQVSWDTSAEVDSDRDGNPTNDADHVGPSFEELAYSSDEQSLALSVVSAGEGITERWQITVPRSISDRGSPVRIDLARIASDLGVAEQAIANASVTQRHMQPLDLTYMTEYEARIEVANGQALVQAPQAGRYVFRVSLGTLQTEVAFWVSREVASGKRLWIFMQDIWNNSGNPWDPTYPKDWPFFTDADVEAKIAFLHDHNIVNIGFAQNLRYSGLDPIGFERWNHSLPDADLEWLIRLLKEPKDAKVFVQLQTIVDPNWGITIDDLRAFVRQKGNLDEAFRSYRLAVKELTDVLAPLHIDYLEVHSTPPLCWINEMAEPLREEAITSWVAVLAGTAFDGAIGVEDFVMGAGFGNLVDPRLLAAADFYLVLVFNNQYCASRDCSVDDVAASMAGLLRDITVYSRLDRSIESFFSFNPRSNVEGLLGQMPPESGGQYTSLTTLDYRAQVRALEGTLVAFLSDPYMQNAMVSPEYWKMLDYEHFAPGTWLEEQVQRDASLQGKPAFAVFDLYNLLINRPDLLGSPALRVRSLP